MILATCSSDTQSFLDAVQHLTVGGGIALAFVAAAIAWVFVTFIRSVLG